MGPPITIRQLIGFKKTGMGYAVTGRFKPGRDAAETFKWYMLQIVGTHFRSSQMNHGPEDHFLILTFRGGFFHQKTRGIMECRRSAFGGMEKWNIDSCRYQSVSNFVIYATPKKTGLRTLYPKFQHSSIPLFRGNHLPQSQS